MKKIRWAIYMLIVFIPQFSFVKSAVKTNPVEKVKPVLTSRSSLYDSLQLAEAGLSKEAFIDAMKGYNYMLESGKIKNDETISIIDFSLPSTEKRLFVIDVKKGVVLFNTYVSHGRNSGEEMATQFSNDPQSLESSLGFYTTADTYKGKHGYSLRLQGEEPNINDNAFNRG